MPHNDVLGNIEKDTHTHTHTHKKEEKKKKDQYSEYSSLFGKTPTYILPCLYTLLQF